MGDLALGAAALGAAALGGFVGDTTGNEQMSSGAASSLRPRPLTSFH